MIMDVMTASNHRLDSALINDFEKFPASSELGKCHFAPSFTRTKFAHVKLLSNCCNDIIS